MIKEAGEPGVRNSCESDCITIPFENFVCTLYGSLAATVPEDSICAGHTLEPSGLGWVGVFFMFDIQIFLGHLWFICSPLVASLWLYFLLAGPHIADVEKWGIDISEAGYSWYLILGFTYSDAGVEVSGVFPGGKTSRIWKWSKCGIWRKEERKSNHKA